MAKFLYYILIVACLSACKVGPKYHRPTIMSPEGWKNPVPACADIPVVCVWWEVFQDETLNSLEEQAVENNPNLEVALYRIEEAWAMAGVSRSRLLPHFDLNPSYNNSAQLFKIFLPNSLPIPGVTTIPPFRIHQLQYTLPFLLNYEIDLWGKNMSRYESDLINVEAQEDAYRASLLTLTSNLASNYFNLRALDAIIDLLQRTIDQRRREYELNKSRFEKGVSNYSDVANASLELTNAESDYYDIKRQRGLIENIIATLAGTAASDFSLPHNPLQGEPPVIPPGLPSEVILRRPDVAQAERTMASQHELIDAAYASFFPSLQLTGIFGFLSPEFKQFLSWKSRWWSIAAEADQNIYDGGERCSNLVAAWARFNEATGTYQQQVLTAFQEVEDALNNLEFQAKQAQSLKSSVESATTAFRLSSNRYRSGITNYIEVVINERQELTAEQSYLNLLGQRYIATVQLIKAIGGSWSCGI